LTEETKKKLKDELKRLNPVIIHRKIADLQEKLERLVVRKKRERSLKAAGMRKNRRVFKHVRQPKD
jgi:glycyl-tRNA synthetase beta subunit